MSLSIEVEQEEDGRWIAEVADLPGVLAYGQTRGGHRAGAVAVPARPGRPVGARRVGTLPRPIVLGVAVSRWPATKARRVLAALLRIGWVIKRQSGGSHRVLARAGWPDDVFAFHDDEEIGPQML